MRLVADKLTTPVMRIAIALSSAGGALKAERFALVALDSSQSVVDLYQYGLQ